MDEKELTKLVVGILKQQYEDPYFYSLNVGAAVAIILDKALAINRLWRITEINLLLCCLNAPIASLASMLLCRHKIRKPYFFLVALLGAYHMLQPESFFYNGFWKSVGIINLGLILGCILNSM